MRVEPGNNWHASPAAWPRNAADLTDTTRCPACFAPLQSVVCSNCSLDLSVPEAHELARVSAEIAHQLDERVGLIGRMRLATAPGRVREIAAVPSAEAPAAALPTAGRPANSPAPAAPSATRAPIAAAASPVSGFEGTFAAPAASAGAASAVSVSAALASAPGAATPRRSGVQIALLVTGISLLSVFAVFFLVYAFINYGLVWRSTIIAAVTVATFVTASVLRRRTLTASAEAVAVFAILLVYLDAFAIRANGLAATDQIDGRAYWGVVLVGSAIAFILWHKAAAVRAASLVGYAVFAPGVGVLVSAFIASPGDFAELYPTTFAISLAIAIGSFIHVAAAARRSDEQPASGASRRELVPERAIVISTGFIALLVAGIVGLLMSPTYMTAPLPLATCSGIALVHAIVHRTLRTARPSSLVDRISSITYAAAVGVGLSIGAATAPMYTLDDATSLVFLAPSLSLAVTVGILLVRKTLTSSLEQASSAAVASAAISAIAVIPAVMIAIAQFGKFIIEALDFDPAPSGAAERMASELDLYSVGAVGLAAVAAAICLHILEKTRVSMPWLVTSGAVVLLLTTTILPSAWLTLTASAALGISGLVVRTLRPDVARFAVATAIYGGFAVTWLGGWTADDTWLAASTVTIAALVYARTTNATPVSAVLTTSGVVAVALIGAAYGGWLLSPSETASASMTSLAAVAILAGAFSAIAALDLGWLSAVERRVVFWLTLSGVLLAVITTTSGWRENAPTAVMLLVFGGAATVTAAASLWSNSGLAVERFAAAILVAPALAATMLTAASILPPLPLAHGLVPAIAAALVAALGLLWKTVSRLGLDIGVGVTAASALTVAIAQDEARGWLVVLITAIVAVIAAISSDGLIGSSSRRRHLGWIALPLATGGLWWALSDNGVSAIELFVLPPAAAIAAIAFLISVRRPQANPRAAATLLFCALLLAIVPIGLASDRGGTGDVIRAAAVLLTSAALLVVGCAIIGRRSGEESAGSSQSAPARQATFARASAVAFAVAGLVGIAIVTVLRGGNSVASAAGVLELWLVPSIIALVTSAVLVARVPRLGVTAAGDSGPSGPRTGQNLVVAAIAVASIFEIAAIVGAPSDSAVSASTRAVLIVAALSALHVAAFATRPPASSVFGPPSGWTALGFAGVAALIGLFVIDTPEWVTAPVAFALIASGALRLSRNPARGSWSTLGAGLAVLLLPTLVLTFSDPVVWRLVALGVVGVATIVIGVVLRLQAPFVIGTVIVIVHALRTFAPQIVAIYEAADWYVWAGIGGVLLVAIAIRYEQRMRDVKKAVGSIASLR